jgi:hypothetical protein
MKIKFWRFECDFDGDDAKVVVPIILLLVAVSVTDLNPIWLIGSLAVYYVLYFFWGDTASAIKRFVANRNMRCPKCKNRKIILQGYQPYKSDEHYPHYFCDRCKTTCVLTDGGLLQI